MTTRLLTDEERVDLAERLKKAKEYQHILDKYVVEMGKELSSGVTWCYEPEAFHEMCKEVEKEARERREARRKTGE